MDTSELEARLEGQAETQTIEFKRAVSWDASLFAKDILAISNVRDGGYIIIGVEDKTFKRQGVTIEQANTFEVDTMKDQIAKYADPHVDFEVRTVRDRNKLLFVVIHVISFKDIPVICRCDDEKAGVIKGRIYYRNSDRRPESAPISNSYDMRDLIEVASFRMHQRRSKLGLVIPDKEVKNQVLKRLDEELGGL